MIDPTRVFLVGTDTNVGKTTLLCELLTRATALGIRAMPYKPAQSGDGTSTSDADRLLAAAASMDLVRAQILAFDFPTPVAPGIAADADAFTNPARIDDAPLVHCRAHLASSIATARPDIVLIEGAGGLWVPMPGGTWQPQWITTLAEHVVVVGRAGLGTINHTICTIDALRGLDVEPVGFFLCESTAPDASCSSNAAVIATARGVPHLGTLPHDRASPSCLLTPLLRRIGLA